MDDAGSAPDVPSSDVALEDAVSDASPTDVLSLPTKRVPADFDWTNISSECAGHVWIIADHFDLGGATVTIPEGVTLRFEGGSLSSGEVVGQETLVEAEPMAQLFDAVELAGTFGGYLSPTFFGAAMDGTTDDRDVFVATLATAQAVGAKVLIEGSIFLDVEEVGRKSIFIEDDTWVEGSEGATIIVNSVLSPAFFLVLANNVTFKNITILYDQVYDANYVNSDEHNALNTSQLKSYLSERHGVRYEAANPVWRGPASYRALFSIEASENIDFEGVTFRAAGESPDRFISWAVKLKEQHSANQTVTSEGGRTAVSQNVRFTDIVMDGVLMGIQGIVQGFTSHRMTSLRYSDAQSADGQHVGGEVDGTYWFPPPHLYYLNTDSSTEYIVRDVEIIDTDDRGLYVGTEAVRASLSGFCNSLKLVGELEGVRVENYSSMRRDGLADLGGITDGQFRNIEGESDSSIFDPSFNFNSVRFVGPMNDVLFENMAVKDQATVAFIYPMRSVVGNNVTMDEVHVEVNELRTDAHGPFGISGSTNTIRNSSLTIQTHSTTQEYRGVIYHNDEARENGSHNDYEVVVRGWRSLDESPAGRGVRLIFVSEDNSNPNYARVYDEVNDVVVEAGAPWR